MLEFFLFFFPISAMLLLVSCLLYLSPARNFLGLFVLLSTRSSDTAALGRRNRCEQRSERRAVSGGGVWLCSGAASGCQKGRHRDGSEDVVGSVVGRGRPREALLDCSL